MVKRAQKDIYDLCEFQVRWMRRRREDSCKVRRQVGNPHFLIIGKQLWVITITEGLVHGLVAAPK